MGRIYKSMQELVGNTPLVELSRIAELPEGVKLFAKLELWNPSGSVKDRVGRYMLDEAEKKGLITPGKSTIVMPTAGNAGLGVAFAALGRGYRIIFVVPKKFSPEKQTLMKALGGEIVSTSREGGMLEASVKADEIVKNTENAVIIDQFKLSSNPLAHYEGTGPEIWNDLEGDIDYVVAGAGSGGTYSGVLKYLKSQKQNITGVLVDPEGSTMGGGEHGDYDVEGIGNDFIPATMDMSLVDKVIKINDAESYEYCKKLAETEGIIAGSSSGAAVSAAVRLAKTLGVHGNIVVILPDRGDRYFSRNLYA